MKPDVLLTESMIWKMGVKIGEWRWGQRRSSLTSELEVRGDRRASISHASVRRTYLAERTLVVNAVPFRWHLLAFGVGYWVSLCSNLSPSEFFTLYSILLRILKCHLLIWSHYAELSTLDAGKPLTGQTFAPCLPVNPLPLLYFAQAMTLVFFPDCPGIFIIDRWSVKNPQPWSSHHGSAETNPPSTCEDSGLIPGLTRWVEGSGIAMSCGAGHKSASHPSLGTSICHRRGP